MYKQPKLTNSPNNSNHVHITVQLNTNLTLIQFVGSYMNRVINNNL